MRPLGEPGFILVWSEDEDTGEDNNRPPEDNPWYVDDDTGEDNNHHGDDNPWYVVNESISGRNASHSLRPWQRTMKRSSTVDDFKKQDEYILASFYDDRPGTPVDKGQSKRVWEREVTQWRLIIREFLRMRRREVN